jgi:pyocin large subunit-like protein
MMTPLLRLAARLGLALLLGVTACDQAPPGTEPVHRGSAAALDTSAPSHPAPRFAPGQLEQHFQKHGAEMGFSSEADYLRAAQALVQGGPGVETYRRGGDTLYFRESTGEFAVVSDRNVLRTYFKPGDGRRYWERQKER